MHEIERPEGERGEFYSVTGHESTGWFSLWDRYPNAFHNRPDRFALYDPRGEFIGTFSTAVAAERHASFLKLDQERS